MPATGTDAALEHLSLTVFEGQQQGRGAGDELTYDELWNARLKPCSVGCRARLRLFCILGGCFCLEFPEVRFMLNTSSFPCRRAACMSIGTTWEEPQRR
jgi:hypothetical protein